MPVTKNEVNIAQEVINLLVGDKNEAEAYSKDPEGWLEGHGYAGVSSEALATCGVGGSGGGAGASASAGGYAGVALPPVGAGAVAQLDYVVYNHYYEDNSITNNIENHGNLDFDQTVQNVEGEGNVVAGDDIENSQVQTQTGDGIQSGGDTNIRDSNVETGEGDQLVDQSTNTDVDVDVGRTGDGGDGGELPNGPQVPTNPGTGYTYDDPNSPTD